MYSKNSARRALKITILILIILISLPVGEVPPQNPSQDRSGTANIGPTPDAKWSGGRPPPASKTSIL